MTVNTAAVTAPDSTNTATQFNIPTTIACGSGSSWGVLTAIPSGLTAGRTYTASVWLRGAVGGEGVSFGLNDCAYDGVMLTNTWKRYTVTFRQFQHRSRVAVMARAVSRWLARLREPHITSGARKWSRRQSPVHMSRPYPQRKPDMVALPPSPPISSVRARTSSWPGDANYRPATSNSLSQAIVAQTVPHYHMVESNGDQLWNRLERKPAQCLCKRRWNVCLHTGRRSHSRHRYT